MFLQSYVVPVCLYSDGDGTRSIESLIGTAFFINSQGLFITARHVIEAAKERSQKQNTSLGLVVKDKNGTDAKSMMAKIENYEFAPSPSDIAIGITNYSGDTLLCLQEREVSVWQDVATFGYPLNAVREETQLNARFHKGYLQRALQENDNCFVPSPPAFELSFPLSRGISGAPLFVPNQPNDVVIGVCVGLNKSETLEYEHEEEESNGQIIRTKKLAVEQFGIAHDLRPLYNWKPDILKGKSLLEASSV